MTVPFPVPGLAPKKARDKRAYTSILYGNGPGYSIRNGGRPAASLPAAGRSLLGMGWGVQGGRGQHPTGMATGAAQGPGATVWLRCHLGRNRPDAEVMGAAPPTL